MVDITKTSFLSAEDICSKLSVSRSTFDRWRRINSPFGLSGSVFQTKVLADMPSPFEIESEGEGVGLTPFPEPALNVGGSPRWDADDVNAWLVENKGKKSRRGFRG